MNKKLLVGVLGIFVMMGSASALYTDTDTYHNTDYFEHGSLGQYSTLSGSASITSGAAYLGSEGLQLSGHIWNTGVTVEPGQTISGYFGKDSGSAGGLVVGFGGSQAEHYEVYYNSGELAIQTRDNDGTDNILASTGTSTGYGTLRYEIHWQEDGTINAELYNESSGGDFLGEVSVTDNSYGSGGVGYRTWNDQGYFDGSPAVGEQYMKNGDVESTDTSMWSTGSRVTTDSYSGSASWEITNPADFNTITTHDNTNLGRLQAGEKYKMVFYAKSTLGQGAPVRFHDGNQYVTPGPWHEIPANSGWNRYSGTFTVSSDPGQVPRLEFTVFDSSTSGSVYFDRVSLYKVADTEDPVENPFDDALWYDARMSANGGNAYTQPMWDGLSLHNFATSNNGAVIHQETTTKDEVEIKSDVYLGESGGADGITFDVWGDQQYSGGDGGLNDGWTIFIDAYNNKVQLMEPDGSVYDSIPFSAWSLSDSGWHDVKIHMDRDSSYDQQRVAVTIDGTTETLIPPPINPSGSYIGIGAWSGGIKDSYKVKNVEVNSGPSIQKFNLNQNSYTNNLPTFDTDVDDLSSLEYVNLTRDGTVVESLNLNGQTNIFNDGTFGDQQSTPTDGSHSYRVVASDTDGLVTQSNSVSVTYDDTNPTVDSFSPSDGVYSSPPDLSASVSDNIELETIEYIIDNTVVHTDTVSGTSASTTYNWQPPDGVFDYQVRVTDAAGNTRTTAIRSVTVDTTNPSVDSTTVTDGSGTTINDGDSVYVTDSEDDISVDASLSDNIELGQAYVILIDTGGGTDTQGSVQTVSGTTDSITQTFTDVGSGSYRVDVVVDDTAGNSITSQQESFTLNVDSTDPDVSNVSFSISGQNVSIEADLSDDQNFADADFNLDSRTKTVTSSGTQSVTFQNVDEGKYNWNPDTSTSAMWKNTTITATDEAGNTYTWEPSVESRDGLYYERADETFLVDVTAPTVDFDTKQNNFDSIELVNASFSDNVGTSHAKLYANGNHFATVCNRDADQDGDSTDEDLFSDPVFSISQSDCDEYFDFENINDGSTVVEVQDKDSEFSTSNLPQADLKDGDNTIEVKLYDGKKQTDSLEKTQNLDLNAPEIKNFDIETPYSSGTNVGLNTTLQITADITDDSSITNHRLGLTVANIGIMGTNLGDGNGNPIAPSLTNIGGSTYQINTTIGDLCDIRENNDPDFSCDEKLDDVEGEIEIRIFAEDEWANERLNYFDTSYKWDDKLTFKNWKSSNPLDTKNIKMSFRTNDDLIKADAKILGGDVDVNFNNSLPTETSWGVFTKVTSGNATIVNNQPVPVFYLYEGESVFSIPADSSKEFNLSKTIDYPGGEQEVSKSNFKSRWDARVQYGDIGTNEWSTEQKNNETKYQTEEEVGSVGVYDIRIELEDTQGNNKTVTREARVRPDGAVSGIYGWFNNNFGISPMILGLVVLYVPIIFSWIKSRKIWKMVMVVWPLLLIGSNFTGIALLPTSAYSMAILTASFWPAATIVGRWLT